MKILNIKQTRFALGLWLALAAGASGCGDGPRQFPNQTPTSASSPGLPDLGGIGHEKAPAEPVEEPETSVDQDALTRRNANEPIIYGVGAGGITFKTEYKDSLKLLSRPSYGPDDDGVTGHKSGMQITWRKTEPRTAQSILMWQDYLGTFDVGGKFGKWKLGEDLSRFFEGDPTGEQFLVDLYNHFEKSPEGFNCLKTGRCKVIGWETPSEDAITFYTAKLVLLISKSRKTLFILRLDDVDEQNFGKLHHDLDLISGEFLVPESEGSRIKLGQTWQEILAINGENGKTEVSYNSIGKSYAGVYLDMTRSDFSRTYKTEPLMTERLKGVTVYGIYPNKLRINGQLIELRIDKNGFGLGLASGDEVEDKMYVHLNLPILEALHVDFVQSLVDLLKTEFSKRGGQTLAQVSGLHKPTGKKKYDAYVLNFDKKAGSGRVVSFSFSEATKMLNYVSVSDVSSVADRLIIPALVTPYVAGETKMAGFQLGDAVKLKDIDLGRGEATVLLPGQSGEERASYADKTTLSVSYDGSRREYQIQSAVTMGTINTRLGLVPDRAEAGGLRVSSISSGAAAVTHICGIKDLNAAPGDDAREVLERIQSTIAAAQQKSADFDCPYFQVNDRRDTGRLESLFFPAQKLRFDFSDRELSLVTVYAHPSEVQK
ncbi:MAG: hypothetical protein NDI61_00365 [Bdellovibrionaceae bacterium]|nr:hypothetical protein [Pseudobdellovibrionaceae bacterium]